LNDETHVRSVGSSIGTAEVVHQEWVCAVRCGACGYCGPRAVARVLWPTVCVLVCVVCATRDARTREYTVGTCSTGTVESNFVI
jgi:hypothetical protein